MESPQLTRVEASQILQCRRILGHTYHPLTHHQQEWRKRPQSYSRTRFHKALGELLSHELHSSDLGSTGSNRLLPGGL